jgi:hypothetical protein
MPMILFLVPDVSFVLPSSRLRARVQGGRNAVAHLRHPLRASIFLVPTARATRTPSSLPGAVRPGVPLLRRRPPALTPLTLRGERRRYACACGAHQLLSAGRPATGCNPRLHRRRRLRGLGWQTWPRLGGRIGERGWAPRSTKEWRRPLGDLGSLGRLALKGRSCRTESHPWRPKKR